MTTNVFHGSIDENLDQMLSMLRTCYPEWTILLSCSVVVYGQCYDFSKHWQVMQWQPTFEHLSLQLVACQKNLSKSSQLSQGWFVEDLKIQKHTKGIPDTLKQCLANSTRMNDILNPAMAASNKSGRFAPYWWPSSDSG
jgi:hypothetical protein